MQPPKEPTGQTPINQEAIHVNADDFPALIASMGPDAINQRFTVSRKKPEQTDDVLPAQETEARAPIEVSTDLLTTFTFGGPDNPAIQKWLDENGIQSGQEVDVLVPDKEGNLVTRRVSTAPNTFFIPVEKLVTIDTDEFDHAEIVGKSPKKIAVGRTVIAERNVYDGSGKRTGEVVPDTEPWKVIGYGEREDGTPTTKIQKITDDQVFDKEVDNVVLEAIQTKYSPESQRQPIPEPEARKIGHQELESAEINEPIPAEDVAVEETPQQEPAQEREPETRQEKYDAIKKKMEDSIRDSGISDLDAFYVEAYAKAGDARYDEQTGYLMKMSPDVRSNTLLIQRYKDLYDDKEALMRG